MWSHVSIVRPHAQPHLRAAALEVLEGRVLLSTVPVVSLAVSDGDASEVGLDPGRFVVSRTGPTDQPLTVYFNPHGDAIVATDYTVTPASVQKQQLLVIPAGQSSAEVVVQPLADHVVEPTEYARFPIVPDSSYEIGFPSEAWIPIADGSGVTAVSVVASDADASEAGDNPGTFTLHRSGDLSQDLQLGYSLGGTADKSDHNRDVSSDGSPTDWVDFAPGQASQDVIIAPNADSKVEGDETVRLTLDMSTPGVTRDGSLPTSASLTIHDGPVVPESVTLPCIADATVAAGADADRNFGTDPELSAGNTAAIGLRQAYLKFDISSVPSVVSASLSLYARGSAGSGGVVSVLPAAGRSGTSRR